jgi:ribosomal protein L7/L12
MEYDHSTYIANLSDIDMACKFKTLSQAQQALIDTLISNVSAKIASIKFLSSELNIGLSEAKRLYDGREQFIGTRPDPFGFK